MNRREAITTIGLGSAGFVVGSVFTAPACGGKSVSGTVTLITGAIVELKLLYPNQPNLDKVVKLANDFNSDWIAGKFDSARTFFENLDLTVQQVIGDLGVNATTQGKLLLGTLGIAVRLVATLIAGQATLGAMKAASVAAPATVSRVKQLSNAADADWILKAVQK